MECETLRRNGIKIEPMKCEKNKATAAAAAAYWKRNRYNNRLNREAKGSQIASEN